MATAALLATTLTLSLTACGGDGEGAAKDQGSSSAPAASGNSKPKEEEGGGNTVPDTSQTLATINGSNGFQFVIHSAVRDDGGFLTVTGTVKNTSGKVAYPPVAWNGQESNVKRAGRSFAGITLVDKAEKKRYYVLRDTEGYPLTTTGVTSIEAGDAGVPFFAQFPAPPDTTSQVAIQIPLMPTAMIEIS
ncbi:hypothetical protein [Streptomyces sp. NBC_00259]|uniref:hypothetical protein n=1 Tax=Streptomyces sp. NBC_00259 TaxID=2903643 RepID=UPI002E2CD900|nr:hypothetical protein [Streptomyces sp. NBC_00259]